MGGQLAENLKLLLNGTLASDKIKYNFLNYYYYYLIKIVNNILYNNGIKITVDLASQDTVAQDVAFY